MVINKWTSTPYKYSEWLLEYLINIYRLVFRFPFFFLINRLSKLIIDAKKFKERLTNLAFTDLLCVFD